MLPAVAQRDGRDSRFLVFVGLVLVALGIAFKSELVAPGQVWGLGGGLLLLAAPALMAYLGSESGLPAIESYIPAALGAVAVAGLSLIVADWWRYALMVGLFGVCFVLAAQLDYRRQREAQKPGHMIVQEGVLAVGLAASFLVVLTARLSLPLELAWIFGLSVMATYRSFRVIGEPMPPRRAFLFAVFVGQLVAFFGWAMTVNLLFSEGIFAVMLLILWYVNRGIIRHTVEETLSRNVVVEYGLFGLLLVYLFFQSYQPH